MKGDNVSTNKGSYVKKGQHPYPNTKDFSPMRSEANEKQSSWHSPALNHGKMRKEAQSNQKDPSGLGFTGFDGGDKLKGE